MSGINKVILIGRLGNDPQINQSGENTVSRISIATSENWKDKQTGEKREATEWHRVVFFGRLAEIASQYLRKGSQVYIEGKLRTSKYTDKEGIERYSTDIVCSGFDSKMLMLDSKSSGDNNSFENNQSNTQNEQEGTTPIPDSMKVNPDNDLPF